MIELLVVFAILIAYLFITYYLHKQEVKVDEEIQSNRNPINSIEPMFESMVITKRHENCPIEILTPANIVGIE